MFFCFASRCTTYTAKSRNPRSLRPSRPRRFTDHRRPNGRVNPHGLETHLDLRVLESVSRLRRCIRLKPEVTDQHTEERFNSALTPQNDYRESQPITAHDCGSRSCPDRFTDPREDRILSLLAQGRSPSVHRNPAQKTSFLLHPSMAPMRSAKTRAKRTSPGRAHRR